MIAHAQLGELLKPVLTLVLRDTGWHIAGIQPERAAGDGIIPNYVAEVRSGSHLIQLAVDVSARLSRALHGQLERLQRAGWDTRPDRAIAVFAPRISGPMRDMLRQSDIGYIDLYGACHLRWPGMYMERPPQSEPIVRPESYGLRMDDIEPQRQMTAQSVFGTRSVKRQRVLRVLLAYPGRRWHQSELAEEAGVSIYTAHTLVSYLVHEHFADTLGAGPDKTVQLTRPGDVLGTWGTYWREMWKSCMRRAGLYYSLAPNPQRIQEHLAAAAAETGVTLGFTLSAGAAHFGSYMRDSQVHAYISGDERAMTHAAGIERVDRGANVLLLPAPDDGIFYLPAHLRETGSSQTTGGAPVSPVQLYLDMQAAGSRYAEQAAVLRNEVLGYE